MDMYLISEMFDLNYFVWQKTNKSILTLIDFDPSLLTYTENDRTERSSGCLPSYTHNVDLF